MKCFRSLVLLGGLLFIFTAGTLSADTIDLSRLQAPLNPGLSMEILEDPAGKFTVQEARGRADWQASPKAVPSFGFTRSVYWVRLRVKNPSARNHEWFLECGLPWMDSVELFEPAGGSRAAGDRLPFAQRDVEHRLVAFRLFTPPGEHTYYLRFANAGTMSILLTAYPPRSFAAGRNRQYALAGVFFGIMGVMFLYNLFLYYSLRDRSHLLYILYLAGASLYQSMVHGIFFEFITPNNTWPNNTGQVVTGLLSFVAGLWFMRVFLETKARLPRLDMAVIFFLATSVLLAGACVFLSYSTGIRLITIWSLFISLFMLSAGLFALWRGLKQARYFVVAWVVLLISILLAATRNLGLHNNQVLGDYSIAFGTLAEVVLLSFALGDRINILREEKESAERDAWQARLRMLDSFSRFVPRQFLKILRHDSIEEVRAGEAVAQDMTVLFADIRGFTGHAEKLQAEEIFDLLNGYLRAMGPLIHRNGGFIDKFIGDAILALFADSADAALRTAIEMRLALRQFNEARRPHQPRLEAGIGINSGRLMLGTVGSEGRMETTVIGDSVNVAARVEGYTRLFGNAVILTDFAYRKLQSPGDFAVREIDTVRVRGREQPVQLYEAYDADPPELAAQKKAGETFFRKAIVLYKAGQFAEARDIFQECRREAPDDMLLTVYIKRCEDLITYGPGEDWTGVYVADERKRLSE